MAMNIIEKEISNPFSLSVAQGETHEHFFQRTVLEFIRDVEEDWANTSEPLPQHLLDSFVMFRYIDLMIEPHLLETAYRDLPRLMGSSKERQLVKYVLERVWERYHTHFRKQDYLRFILIGSFLDDTNGFLLELWEELKSKYSRITRTDLDSVLDSYRAGDDQRGEVFLSFIGIPKIADEIRGFF